MVTAVHNRDRLNTVFNDVGPLRADGERLGAALFQQQSAVRGAALSGDRADLQQYRSGVALEHDMVAELSGLLANQPALRDQLSQVESQMAAWRSGVAEPV